MFIVAERDSVRHRLLELAAADPSVAAAATTGSYAVGGVDEWSDIDLAFGIRDAIPAALARWTELLYRDFGAVHHWDLPSGSSIYRVFLTASWLEVDIAFTPVTEFGPLGPSWQTVFGEAVALVPSASPRLDDLVGRAWHHALHANASIERGRAWQAEYWISGVRDQVVALACVRLGQPTWYARGAPSAASRGHRIACSRPRPISRRAGAASRACSRRRGARLRAQEVGYGSGRSTWADAP